MITGDYEMLNQVIGTHRCPDHPDKALVVAWLTTGNYAIRCGGDHFPEEVERIPSLTEELKIGGELPSPIAENVVKGAQRRAAAAGKQEKALVLGELPKADLATGEALREDQIQALRRYALKYALDPFRGHVCLFHGAPYVTIDGYLYHARMVGESYQLRSKPLTKTEREDYKIGEADHAWIAEVTKYAGAGYFTGLGIVTAEELTTEAKGKPGQKRYPVVAAHPWQLAQKRAEWQALRRAFPIGESQEEVS